MFLLFGMGPTRRKLLFQYPDTLRDALTGEAVCHWRTRATRLDAAACTVTMETPNGDVRLSEDTHGVWLEASGDRRALTTGAPVALPTFAESPHAAVLRILHAEVLVNLMPFGPVPNLWAYPRPWYRDAAMVLMCLRHTGNLHLVEPWVHGLRSPYDFNNGGIPEADNLGQVLYMLALVDARHHPLVEKIFQEIPRFLDGKHLRGLSDYAEHPVYQTKWLKYGLQHLGLDDPYRIPAEYDSYSALFWMDYRDQHVPGPGFSARDIALYPYLGWAEAHFHRTPPPLPITAAPLPLTWETQASDAEYWRLDQLFPATERHRSCRPHTWHAAEMLLYLRDADAFVAPP